MGGLVADLDHETLQGFGLCRSRYNKTAGTFAISIGTTRNKTTIESPDEAPYFTQLLRVEFPEPPG